MKYLLMVVAALMLTACARPPATEAELARGSELIREWQEHCSGGSCRNALILYEDGSISRLTFGTPHPGETDMRSIEQWALHPEQMARIVNFVRPDETEEYNTLAGAYLRQL